MPRNYESETFEQTDMIKTPQQNLPVSDGSETSERGTVEDRKTIITVSKITVFLVSETMISANESSI